MRIAIFTDLYLEVAGGIPSSIKAQKAALKEMGHKVTVFCPGRECDDSDIVLLPTSWLKVNGAPMAKRPGEILKFLEREFPDFAEQFDLIHAHYEAEVSIAAVMAARKYELPLVQTMHGREDMAVAINFPAGLKSVLARLLNKLHKHYLWRYLDEEVQVFKDDYLAPTLARARMWELMVRQANAADAVLTPSRHFADKLEVYGVKKKIQVLSNGVADEIANSKKWKVRKFDESYRKDGEKLRLFWASRVSKEKRIMPFLEALKLVREHTDAFFLTVVGDGNEIGKARRFVEKNGLSENVAFLGAVPHPQVMEMLENQHLSVTNSFGFDTQGLTLLEATATGVPVIYCDKDMDSVVIPGTGLRAEDESPKAMAELILKILEDTPVIEKMSRKALEKRGEVLQSNMVKKLAAIYVTCV